MQTVGTHPTDEHGDDVGAARREYLASIGNLDAAYRGLNETLLHATAALIALRSHLERHGSAREFFTDVQPMPLRSDLAHALDGLERARHESIRLLYRLLQAEGSTKADIARTFGVSRQLVSRLLGETD